MDKFSWWHYLPAIITLLYICFFVLGKGMKYSWKDFAIGLIIIIVTAVVTNQINSCGVSREIEKINNTIYNPETNTGLAIKLDRIDTGFKNHLLYHEASKLFNRILESATSDKERKSLLEDADLFLMSPEGFLKTHKKDMPWLEQYRKQIENLSVQMQTLELLKPPK